MAQPQLTFPLKPKRRLAGLAYGAMHSARRGTGSDIAGSRPYRRGDDVKAIDWPASAKLSRARGTDEFVVREHYADEAPRIVVLCDRRPSMSLYPPGWPWLQKREALRVILRLIADSALAAQGYAGYLDHGSGESFWRPPKSQRTLHELDLDRPFRAPGDALARGLEELIRHRRDVPAGTFVFVVSDFLAPPTRELWLRVLARRWDVIPVVVQDRVWEQSFPDVGGIVIPFADPATGKTRYAELAHAEVGERRRAHEERRAQLVRTLRGLDLEPVLVETSEVRSIFSAFLSWVDRRRYGRGRSW
ncbi:MAG: DUF58 domain-containing protein [Actinobacteria bacterium]|nr:DUF58 domain-containing protein [Actinomycetota bacterium]